MDVLFNFLFDLSFFRYATFLRRTRAAIIIQKTIRMFIQRKKYLRICRTVLGIQTFARGMWARQKFLQMRKNAAATIIQVIFFGCS